MFGLARATPPVPHVASSSEREADDTFVLRTTSHVRDTRQYSLHLRAPAASSRWLNVCNQRRGARQQHENRSSEQAAAQAKQSLFENAPAGMHCRPGGALLALSARTGKRASSRHAARESEPAGGSCTCTPTQHQRDGPLARIDCSNQARLTILMEPQRSACRYLSLCAEVATRWVHLDLVSSEWYVPPLASVCALMACRSSAYGTQKRSCHAFAARRGWRGRHA